MWRQRARRRRWAARPRVTAPGARARARPGALAEARGPAGGAGGRAESRGREWRAGYGSPAVGRLLGIAETPPTAIPGRARKPSATHASSTRQAPFRGRVGPGRGAIRGGPIIVLAPGVPPQTMGARPAPRGGSRSTAASSGDEG